MMQNQCYFIGFFPQYILQFPCLGSSRFNKNVKSNLSGVGPFD